MPTLVDITANFKRNLLMDKPVSINIICNISFFFWWKYKKLYKFYIDIKFAENVIYRNNAGLMFCPYQLSDDGIELQFATNHIGKLKNI